MGKTNVGNVVGMGRKTNLCIYSCLLMYVDDYFFQNIHFTNLEVGEKITAVIYYC